MLIDPQIIGLILAGGGGQRLGGVRKDDVRLGNVRLFDHVRRRLAPQCAALLLSVEAGRNAEDGDVVVLPDSPDGLAGPAAGLLAGAKWCAERAPGALLVSVSVDTPFFPADFVSRALELLAAECGCLVGAYDGRDYPTNALWRPDHLLAHLVTIPPAPRGPRLRDIQSALGARHLDYADGVAANPFAGINQLSDLLALDLRLKTEDR
ncbi:NTP transferase domain-containing protein [Pelagibacterium sp. 26DY04]|uniref:molybdenum cofactor guanylyltransferase n=1 Tax=Pelagibacterium sp. 26DY04 TaxID=2967130 RepID=UPI0028150C3E|nr:NTP transferase domain-containing protein [Pelagibacterium sp. 26DY04]WMT88648.1 NTP transferase domain-containing protein [Pelagibacterium sp. 26DY04]